MATRAKTLSARTANKAARAERRDEIIARWNVRMATRLFAQRFEGMDSRPFSMMLDELLYYGKWADRAALMLELDISYPGLRRFIGWLVRVIELKEMPYDEYLQTSEWKGKAAEVKSRFGGNCALDATHAAEHAHHRTYERRGREWHDDLVPLCAACHGLHHGRGR